MLKLIAKKVAQVMIVMLLISFFSFIIIDLAPGDISSMYITEDMTEAEKNPKLFGNQCSFGAYWGWGRVINSANYGGTNEMVLKNGFLRVGDYSYAPYGDSLEKFDKTK